MTTGSESKSRHPIDSDTFSCDFSGWVRDANCIVQEWIYRGQGLNHRLVVELSVELGVLDAVVPGSALRFVHIWLTPANGYEGNAEILLRDSETEETPGWLTSRMTTAKGNATLLNVATRAGADAVWRLFSSGDDLDFAVRMNSEVLLTLPMPNNSGVQQHYESILNAMRG